MKHLKVFKVFNVDIGRQGFEGDIQNLIVFKASMVIFEAFKKVFKASMVLLKAFKKVFKALMVIFEAFKRVLKSSVVISEALFSVFKVFDGEIWSIINSLQIFDHSLKFLVEVKTYP